MGRVDFGPEVLEKVDESRRTVHSLLFSIVDFINAYKYHPIALPQPDNAEQ